MLRTGVQPRAQPDCAERLEAGTPATLHGLVYDLKDGLLRELLMGVDGPEKVGMDA